MNGDVPPDVFTDFARLIAPKAGIKVMKRKPAHLSGHSTDGGHKNCEVWEWVNAAGEVVGRKVTVRDQTERWLRADLCTEVLIARSDEVAERERVIGEVKAYAAATRQHSRDQMAETYVLSSALLHASARHQARIGRLYDMNSRGDRVRGNLAAALERAAKAESKR